MEKISIVVPTLNEQNNIENCLGSVLAQEQYVGEILVVDCYSSDGTVGLVKKLQEEHPTIKLLNSKDKSYAAAVSVGVESASCEFVQLVDGDSLLAEDWLQVALNHLRENRCDSVLGTIYLENDSLYGDIRKSAKNVEVAFGGPALFRAAVLKRHNYDPDLKRSSDVDVYLRLQVAGHVLCALSKPMIVKDDRDNTSISWKKASRQGYYSGMAVVKNASSRAYVEQFVSIRCSYPMFALFLFLGAVGGAFVPRLLMAAYLAAPVIARIFVRGGGLNEGLLWYVDRLIRSAAFAVAVSREPRLAFSMTLKAGMQTARQARKRVRGS